MYNMFSLLFETPLVKKFQKAKKQGQKFALKSSCLVFFHIEAYKFHFLTLTFPPGICAWTRPKYLLVILNQKSIVWIIRFSFKVTEVASIKQQNLPALKQCTM